MRIALDATPLCLPGSGLRRYVTELSGALANEFAGDEFVLASDQPFPPPPRAPANLSCLPGPQNRVERRWWSFGLNRALSRCSVEVFHGCNFEVPYVPLRPSVLTLHDLSPWLDPSWHDGADRVRSRVPRLLRSGAATMVITPTEAVRRHAIEHFRLAAARVVAVPEAAAAHLQVCSPPPGAGRYFLFVGALEPRKNLEMLVEAWRSVRARCGADLVLAGCCRPGYVAPAPCEGLRVPGEVPDDQLAALYSGALAFVYPSLYEGFGLPVIEAMQCGAPVIASRDPAIAEVAGGAAVLVDARDPRAWAEAMLAATSGSEWPSAWRSRSLERSRQFSWARTARLTREVYDEAVRRF